MESKTQAHLPSKKKFLFLFLVQFMVSVCVFSYFRMFKDPNLNVCSTGLEKASTQASTQAKRIEEKLVILLWTWPFGMHFDLDKCEEIHGISGCYLTVNRSMYDQADAVVFHFRDVCNSKGQMPQIPRPTNQRWIWFNMESPTHSPNMGLMDNLMNLTMSYRQDSDIFTPYGWVETVAEPQNFSIPNKTKLVSWAVSHWNPGHARVKYWQELRKHIKLDMFGNGRIPLARESDMIHSTISQYKFYLAFENSQHEDYITEKLWDNALLSGTVPVVLGPTRKNYERFLPADAFIHVDDFPSAQEMAAYLKLLDSDDKKYQRYFDWRRRLRAVSESNWHYSYCKACQYLQQNKNYKTISSVAKWFK